MSDKADTDTDTDGCRPRREPFLAVDDGALGRWRIWALVLCILGGILVVSLLFGLGRAPERGDDGAAQTEVQSIMAPDAQ